VTAASTNRLTPLIYLSLYKGSFTGIVPNETAEEALSRDHRYTKIRKESLSLLLEFWRDH
jgi:hypothetical protein